MNICVKPRVLRGEVTPPPSKSLLHREVIAAALAGEWPELRKTGDDVRYTLRALRKLEEETAPTIDCGDSGSTLRFLIPVAMARGQIGTMFTGSRRLLSRPIPGDWGLERTQEGWRVTRALRGGVYSVEGSKTSQLISGLLMALPLCREDSELCLEGKLVSRPYVDMTIGVLKRHGVSAEETPQGWHISGGRQYRKAPLQMEGDWSAAAWYVVLNALGADIVLHGMRQDTLQGDRVICRLCRELPEEIPVSQNPDLLPPLALLTALQPGKETRLTGGGFLRDKESDRLRNTAEILRALGGCVREEHDGLVIRGVSHLKGGSVNGCGDHRMVMLAACAAMRCREPVEIRGAECVSKSYPDFWRDYEMLGGEVTEA